MTSSLSNNLGKEGASFHFYFVGSSDVFVDDVVLEEVWDSAAAAEGQGRQDLEVADPLLQMNHSVFVETLQRKKRLRDF